MLSFEHEAIVTDQLLETERSVRDLYKITERVIRSTALRILGPGDPEHEDLVQSCFVQLLQSLRRGTFRSDCSLSTWAASIATNTSLNVIRSRRINRRRLEEDRAVDQFVDRRSNPEDLAAARSELRQLSEVVGELGAKSTSAWFLRDALGFEIAEVADALEISTSAAQSRIVRTRARMRAHADEKTAALPRT